MPIFSIDGDELDLPRNLALLDTNFVVSAVDKNDGSYGDVSAYLELNQSFQLFVTIPVLVESWGLLSRIRRFDWRFELFRWALKTTNVNIISPVNRPLATHDLVSRNASWMAKWEIDYVDAHLMEFAHSLTEKCDLKPHAPIITSDARDFLRCAGQGYRYSLYDMRTSDLQEFN